MSPPALSGLSCSLQIAVAVTFPSFSCAQDSKGYLFLSFALHPWYLAWVPSPAAAVLSETLRKRDHQALHADMSVAADIYGKRAHIILAQYSHVVLVLA